MIETDSSKPSHKFAALRGCFRALSDVAGRMDVPLNKRFSIVALSLLLAALTIGSLIAVGLQVHYEHIVAQNQLFSRYEASVTSKVAAMEERIALLSDEVAARNSVYRKMIAILEAYGTDIPVVERRDFVRFVYHESLKNDLDPILAMAVIKVESTFETTAVSSVGAVGLMQVIPYVGKYKAGQLGIPWKGEKTLYDPYINVRIGIAYLMELTNQFHDFDLALEAYNRGPTALRATMTAGITPSKPYARRVLQAYTRFQRI